MKFMYDNCAFNLVTCGAGKTACVFQLFQIKCEFFESAKQTRFSLLGLCIPTNTIQNRQRGRLPNTVFFGPEIFVSTNNFLIPVILTTTCYKTLQQIMQEYPDFMAEVNLNANRSMMPRLLKEIYRRKFPHSSLLLNSIIPVC